MYMSGLMLRTCGALVRRKQTCSFKQENKANTNQIKDGQTYPKRFLPELNTTQ